jgi:hypothetical protein
MSDTPTTPADPTPQPEKQVSFLNYLITTLLADPKAKAMLGCITRWLLNGAGAILGATSLGHLCTGVANNADWVMLIAGTLLSGSQLVWGIYQKWCVNRKITKLQTHIEVLKGTAP